MRLTHKDRKAIIIIAGALLLLNIGVWIFQSPPLHPRKDGRIEGLKDGRIEELMSTPHPASEENGGGSSEPFPFDPNTADSATFVELGLRPRVAHAIIRYRAAGGTFRRPQDFARIYTLSDEDFRRLLPYIYIKEKGAAKPTAISSSLYERRDFPAESKQNGGLYPTKLHAGETVPLSTADTSDLKRIPGIGSYYSAKIVRYRERLGGFVSLGQLAEIEGLPENIARWVTLGKTEIRKLPINTGTFGQLLRHPYLNYEQVSAIINYRKAYGALRDLTDLKTSTAFSDSDFQRLQPYVAF